MYTNRFWCDCKNANKGPEAVSQWEAEKEIQYMSKHVHLNTRISKILYVRSLYSVMPLICHMFQSRYCTLIQLVDLQLILFWSVIVVNNILSVCCCCWFLFLVKTCWALQLEMLHWCNSYENQQQKSAPHILSWPWSFFTWSNDGSQKLIVYIKKCP